MREPQKKIHKLINRKAIFFIPKNILNNGIQCQRVSSEIESQIDRKESSKENSKNFHEYSQD